MRLTRQRGVRCLCSYVAGDDPLIAYGFEGAIEEETGGASSRRPFQTTPLNWNAKGWYYCFVAQLRATPEGPRVSEPVQR